MFNSTCKPETVVEQSPAPNARLEQAGTVIIKICGGKPDVQIPAGLVNSQFENVKPQLVERGLVVVERQVDNPAQKGIVVRVSPPSGTTVAQGTKVTLDVSRGNVSKVPNVINSTRSEAEKELREAGYVPRFRDGTEVPADQAGRVQTQNPDPGTELAQGKTVTIEIGIPEKVETPPTGTTSPTATPTNTPSTPGNGGGTGQPFPPPIRLPED
ncbi:hypothetical protein GCM10027614_48130 [Micromonospora vulcania]